MTSTAEPNLDDADTDNEVLVTDKPTDEADNPKGSNNQPTDTPADSWEIVFSFLYIFLFLWFVI